MAINCSLRFSHVPSVLKIALFRLLLTKPSLDPEVLANYRPISNLPFLSKVLEKIVVGQLETNLQSCGLYKKFKSGSPGQGHKWPVGGRLLELSIASGPCWFDSSLRYGWPQHTSSLFKTHHRLETVGGPSWPIELSIWPWGTFQPGIGVP